MMQLKEWTGHPVSLFKDTLYSKTVIMAGKQSLFRYGNGMQNVL